MEDKLTISLPAIDERTKRKLDDLIKQKEYLLKKATGAEELPVIYGEKTTDFPWFILDPETAEACCEFITHLVRFAESRNRINKSATDYTKNEKYYMHTFLNDIGLRGPKYKSVRKYFTDKLDGDTASLKPRKSISKD